MSRARAAASVGAMTALWLSACTTTAPWSERSVFSELDLDTDTTLFESCNTTLVETLVNRDIEELIVAASDFKRPNEDDGLSREERIKAYKADRTKQLSVFFDCSDKNKALNFLGTQIAEEPNNADNPDRFSTMVVLLATERMDDVRGVWPIEDIKEVAHVRKDHLLKQNEEALKDFDHLIDDNVLEARVDKVIEDNYDTLAMSATRLELADHFNMEHSVQNTSLELLVSQFQSLINDTVREYLKEVVELYNLQGPRLEA